MPLPFCEQSQLCSQHGQSEDQIMWHLKRSRVFRLILCANVTHCLTYLALCNRYLPLLISIARCHFVSLHAVVWRGYS